MHTTLHAIDAEEPQMAADRDYFVKVTPPLNRLRIGEESQVEGGNSEKSQRLIPNAKGFAMHSDILSLAVTSSAHFPLTEFQPGARTILLPAIFFEKALALMYPQTHAQEAFNEQKNDQAQVT